MVNVSRALWEGWSSCLSPVVDTGLSGHLGSYQWGLKHTCGSLSVQKCPYLSTNSLWKPLWRRRDAATAWC